MSAVDPATLADLPHEVRVDPVHGWPVLFAPARALRPFDISSQPTLSCVETDPFREGRESVTTPESYAIRDKGSPPNSPGWKVRIIPNKYPVLETPAAPNTDDPSNGIHEVIVECPQSESQWMNLNEEQTLLVLRSYRARLKMLTTEPGIEHVTLFKNQGIAAGASLAHVHSQLIATRFVPPAMQLKMRHAKEYFQQRGVDYYAALIASERDYRKRVIRENEHFLLYCPEASRFAFEMKILPKDAEPHFASTSDAMLKEVNQLLRAGLESLRRVAGDVDFNYVLQTAPFTAKDTEGFRWHWEIFPRISGIAGWELGAGSYVNAVYPETAAHLLRNADNETSF